MLKFKNLVAFSLGVSMMVSVSGNFQVSATNISSGSKTYQNIQLNDISFDESLRTLDLIRSLIASGDEMEALDLVIAYYESLGLKLDYETEKLYREVILITEEDANITTDQLFLMLESDNRYYDPFAKLTDAEKQLVKA